MYGFYPDIPKLLRQLHEAGILIAAASRTYAPELAREMVKLLGAEECFDAMEIYPGSKVKHIMKLRQKMGVGFEDMIFFDDERRNVDVQKELDVLLCLVSTGVDARVFGNGVRTWREGRL